MKPLTREEVLGWGALGPMTLDPARVLALLDDRDALLKALAAWRDWLQDGNSKPYSKKAWKLTAAALVRDR